MCIASQFVSKEKRGRVDDEVVAVVAVVDGMDVGGVSHMSGSHASIRVRVGTENEESRGGWRHKRGMSPPPFSGSHDTRSSLISSVISSLLFFIHNILAHCLPYRPAATRRPVIHHSVEHPSHQRRRSTHVPQACTLHLPPPHLTATPICTHPPHERRPRRVLDEQ